MATRDSTSPTGLTAFNALPDSINTNTLQSHLTDFHTTLDETGVVTITPNTAQYTTTDTTDDTHTYTLSSSASPTLTTLLDIALTEITGINNATLDADWPTTTPLALRQSQTNGYTITLTRTTKPTNTLTEPSAPTAPLRIPANATDALKSVITLFEGLRYIKTHPATNTHATAPTQPPTPSVDKTTTTRETIDAAASEVYEDLQQTTPTGWRVRWMTNVLTDLATPPTRIAEAAGTPLPTTVYYLAILNATDVLSHGVDEHADTPTPTEPAYELSNEYKHTLTTTERTEHHKPEQEHITTTVTAADIPRITDTVLNTM